MSIGQFIWLSTQSPGATPTAAAVLWSVGPPLIAAAFVKVPSLDEPPPSISQRWLYLLAYFLFAFSLVSPAVDLGGPAPGWLCAWAYWPAYPANAALLLMGLFGWWTVRSRSPFWRRSGLACRGIPGLLRAHANNHDQDH